MSLLLIFLGKLALREGVGKHTDIHLSIPVLGKHPSICPVFSRSLFLQEEDVPKAFLVMELSLES